MNRPGNKKEITKQLRALIPNAPLSDFLAIEELANAGHLRHLPPSIAAWQATASRVRHAHTDYDALLADGYDQDSARHFVLEDINNKLLDWGCTRQISEKED